MLVLILLDSIFGVWMNGLEVDIFECDWMFETWDKLISWQFYMWIRFHSNVLEQSRHDTEQQDTHSSSLIRYKKTFGIYSPFNSPPFGISMKVKHDSITLWKYENLWLSVPIDQ